MLKIAWSRVYNHPLPAGHRFPMAKYDVLPEQLCHEGTATADNFFCPEPLAEPLILATHAAGWWHKLKHLSLSAAEVRATGFPLSAALVEREVTILTGTVRAADFARQYGAAMNIAGGTHHAFTDRGEGFCLLNDVAVAAHYLLNEQKAKKILVVDLDVHQGNGTAQIFRHEPRVFTFSMHGEKNYPHRKEQSDLDMALPCGTGDTAYLALLRNTLARLMDEQQPDFVFYIAGVDVLATDKLGRLGLSRAGCKERDRMVLATCRTQAVPVCVSMGGGYSERLADIIEAHANTYRLAQELFF
jgi:acetoin utilization deacetylase AcuC-like enzyme